VWARRFGGERVWGIEDCRHDSGALERFLLARRERVVRVRLKLMTGARRLSRERGSPMSSTPFSRQGGAARGLAQLPIAQLAGPALDGRLLVDHRERLVG
jgi:transposase